MKKVSLVRSYQICFEDHSSLSHHSYLILLQQLILSDEEKQLIKNKIKENKQKRLKVNDSSNSSDSQTFSSHFLSLNKHLRNLIATPLTQLPPQPQQPWLVSYDPLFRCLRSIDKVLYAKHVPINCTLL